MLPHTAPATIGLLDLTWRIHNGLLEPTHGKQAPMILASGVPCVSPSQQYEAEQFSQAIKASSDEAQHVGLLIDLQPALDEIRTALVGMVNESRERGRISLATVCRVTEAVGAYRCWLPAISIVLRNPPTLPDDLKRALGLAFRLFDATREIYRCAPFYPSGMNEQDAFQRAMFDWTREAARLRAIYTAANEAIRGIIGEFSPTPTREFWRFSAPTAHEVVLRMAHELVEVLGPITANDDPARWKFRHGFVVATYNLMPWPGTTELNTLQAALESEARDAARRREQTERLAKDEAAGGGNGKANASSKQTVQKESVPNAGKGGRDKFLVLLAVLNCWHKYNQGCQPHELNLQPITGAELVRQTKGVVSSPDTASRFFAAKFEGADKYTAICNRSQSQQKPELLFRQMQRINGDLPAELTYGDAPVVGRMDGRAKGKRAIRGDEG